MITGKQRSYLKSLAHDIDPTVYIGKAGVTDNVIKEIDMCLEARELVKVKLQDGCVMEPKDVANDMRRSWELSLCRQSDAGLPSTGSQKKTKRSSCQRPETSHGKKHTADNRI